MDEPIITQKYHVIITTSKKLFWKYGFRKVSIEEICKEAQVSKMTFYKFFKNKAELAKSVIDSIMKSSIEQYNEIMNLDIPFSEKIAKQVILKHELTFEISKEFVSDIFTDDKLGLRQYWEKYANEFSRSIIRDFKAAQDKGWIRQDVNLDFVLFYNKKLMELINDTELNAMYSDYNELIMEMTKMFFYGICNHKD